MNNEELLKELLEETRKNAKYQKRTMQILFGLFLILLVAAIVILPQVYGILASAKGIVTQAESSLLQINEMTASITETSRNLNNMVSQNAAPLADSMSKLQNIDFDGLNQAISDLQAAVGPFAKVMKAF
ncbi:MAG: hypothetical protein K5894_05795 [Lachnospiraceae bacterium]|nr:hypothetical protein [Lachnospiraceae bacterium]MDN4745196.1 hypothetical protein [Lachnospiraceae bacterium C1.1]